MLALRLAWRNLWRSRRRTAIILTAVAVGIAGVVFSMAINNGMLFQMLDTAISTELGHLQVHAPGFEANPALRLLLRDWGRIEAEGLQTSEGVRAWAPRVRSDGLIFSPRASVGVRVLGVDPKQEARVSSIAGSVIEGRYLDGTPRRLLVGEALARRLHVGVGDKVVLSVQDLEGDLTGEAYRVAGLFRTASLELDRGTVFLRLEESQKLFRVGGAISEIVVLAERRRDIPAIRNHLEARLGQTVEVRSWGELQPLLQQMIELFDAFAWYVYGAVFVAMAFGIANVLLMTVYERIREIGILMAIGAKPRRIVAMIVTESTILTFLGLLLGYGVAVAAVAALHDGIDLSRWGEGLTAYGIPTRIVPMIRTNDVVIPIVVALVTAVVASLWPALHAVRFRPAEAVRHI